MHHLPNVNERNLARYLNDGLAAQRHAMQAYESAMDHATDDEARAKLGEFKADCARLYELTRVAIKSVGAEPSRGKEAAAIAGTYLMSAIAGSSRDAYAHAREVKTLLGGELMARWDWENLARIAERADHQPSLLAAREGITVAERHVAYLEDRTRELFDGAMAEPSYESPEPATPAGAEGLPSRAV